jgi:hypothetical protein
MRSLSIIPDKFILQDSEEYWTTATIGEHLAGNPGCTISNRKNVSSWEGDVGIENEINA